MGLPAAERKLSCRDQSSGCCDDDSCCEKPVPVPVPLPPPVPVPPVPADIKPCCEPKPLIAAMYRPQPKVEAAEPKVEVQVTLELRCTACTDAPGAVPHEMVRTALRVRGICCDSEVRLVEKLLRPLRGLSGADAVDVNVISKMVYVQHCAAVCCLPPEQIAATLNSAQLALNMLCPLIACALLGLAPIAFTILNTAWVGGGVAVEMKLLMLVATLGALGVGEDCDAALLVALFGASQLVEHAAMPSTATRAADGAQVALSELKKGDRISLRAGEQCSADGRVVAGKAVVSEAALTGEHAPRTVGKGDELAAGCLVLTGYCEYCEQEYCVLLTFNNNNGYYYS
ncbi:hypothetical protein T492DRAFT_1139561 [Pavlovales sp. CCMP2436]|nr:hypothetical protein T492DRAFT_1139561 [Pavlovales sp. CCMP2436]